MKLASHNRFEYSAIHERPAFTWPQGKRLAVYIAVCLEHFSYNEGLGISFSPGLAHPNTYNWAWREYGNRVGGWRMAEIAKQYKLPLTVLLNTACYEHCPALVKELRGGHGEIVAHGRTNSEHQNGMSKEDELKMIEEVRDAIIAHEGKAPAGWMSPGANPSARTEDLLQQTGFTYTLDWPMDEQPVHMKAGAGHLLSVPYPHEINDVPAIALHHLSGEQFAQAAIDNFDELLLNSRGQSVAYGITLHTFIAGQPFRLKQLRRVFEHMNAHSKDVWFTTPGAIAQHYNSLFPATTS
jgi:allantoinase